MDEKTLLNAPEEEYMNDEQLAFFDARLQALRKQTLEEIESIRA